MLILYNNNKNPDDLLAQCLREREAQVRRFEDLIYRSSMISATLVGIVTAFVDIHSNIPVLQFLTVFGVLSLSLSVVAGISYSWKMIKSSLDRISDLTRRCLKGTLEGNECGVDQTNAGWLAISCLVLLCFGILSFAARILIIVLFLP